DNAAIGGASTTGSAGGGIGGALYNSGTVSIALGVLFDNNTSLGGQSTSGAGGGAHGGAIANDDQIDIDHAVIRSNIAIGGGGGSAGGVAEGAGVFNDSAGHVTIADSTITNNLAAAGSVASAPTGVAGARAAGGGIRNDGGVLAITRSTIDNNQALGGSGGTGTAGNGGAGGDGIGGGISNSGNLDLTNSTLYANAADGALGGGATLFSGAGGKALGGGIHNSGSIDLINVTLVANAAHGGAGGTSGIPGAAGEARGGAIYNQENASLINTIVADNTTTQGNPDLGGTSFTLIHSLISANADSFGATPTPASTGNFFGVPANLGPFQDNGGPTKTFEPLAGSLAIDNGDNPVAIAQFGIGGTDQRGRDRYVGTVDIGSVEVQAPPQIKVTGGGWDIANNDTTPRVADGTDFGAVAQGAPSRQQLFMVFNTGGHTLETLAPALPAGYTIVEPLDTTLAPGAFDSFTVALSTAAVGTFGGEVVISSNDPDDATFKFAITGKVTPSAGAAIKINFQPAGRPVPAGYLADFGAVFGSRGNGFSYGWNLSAGSFTRDRGINPDQKFDTFVHTQLFGSRTWEIGVPVGTYSVKIVAGDPQFFDSVYKINVEGQLAVNGTPTSGSRFITGAKNVTVIDGKLTITNASGSANNKIAFVEITPITTGVKINFQPVGRPIPTGYFADTGALFGNRGNGFSYGWNATASSFARDRNAFGVDQQYDTFIHTQLFGERTWELGVANGTYEVRIVAGDPNYFDSVYKFNVEGLLTVNGTPSSGSRFVEGMRTVTVTDGKLTITNASGSVNNKIAFVEVFAV
ncbi:MAG: hypothetical protein QOF78_4582, partial [Phycisphaerales bacterium]|nr:hypothetical protein [Phycisphaerales bacterium]